MQSSLQWCVFPEAFPADFGMCFTVKHTSVSHFWEFTSKRIIQYTVKSWLPLSWKYSSFPLLMLYSWETALTLLSVFSNAESSDFKELPHGEFSFCKARAEC